jgi:hypothetical protein
MTFLMDSSFRFSSTEQGRWAVVLAAVFTVKYVTHIQIIESVYQIAEHHVDKPTGLPTHTIWMLW